MNAAARILLKPDTRLICPQCKHEFAVSAGFAERALEQVEEASAEALARLREEERSAAERQAAQLAKERDAAHARALAEMRVLTAQGFAPQIESLKEQLVASQRTYEKRVAEQDARLLVLQAEQLALREERQKLHDEKASMALDIQRKVDLQLQQREALVRSQEQERAQWEKADLQKKLDDASIQLAAAQRKMEQGSQ